MKLISEHKVPHEGPLGADILFLGDAPTEKDQDFLQPFSGQSRDMIEQCLAENGMENVSVRYGNLLNYKPSSDNLKRVLTFEQLHEGKRELRQYLNDHPPRVIVPTEPYVLDFLLSFNSIEKHRGSVYELGNGKTLVLPMVHPKILQRVGQERPTFLIDFKKLARIHKEGFKEPDFNFIIDPDVYQTEGLFPVLLEAPRLYVDIETKKYTSFIRCIQFAWTDKDAVCFYNDGRYPDNPIGPSFRRILSTLLSSPIPKTFHNGMFDTIMLRENGFEVENFDYDTMVAQHVLQPELPIGLDYCTSIYTDINYYKDDGKDSSDRIDRFRLGVYGCKDVVATARTQAAQAEEFDDTTRKYFEYKMKQIPLAKHFSFTGMLVDEERREELSSIVQAKKESDYTVFLGIQQLSGVTEYFKTSQPKRVADFLYSTLDLPKKYNKEGNLTSDEDALVSLIGHVNMKIDLLKTENGRAPWNLKLAALKLILRIRGHEKMLSSYIDVKTSLDGRVRSWYKFFGTETGRWSAASWYDETGLNGQTIPREVL